MLEQKQKEEVFVGSGNVFQDLGYPNPEEALAKAKLIFSITTAIKNRGLNRKNRRDRKKVAALLHLSSPDEAATIWEKLANGQIRKFTIGQLVDYLAALDEGIEIIVRKAAQFQVTLA